MSAARTLCRKEIKGLQLGKGGMEGAPPIPRGQSRQTNKQRECRHSGIHVSQGSGGQPSCAV